MLVLSRRRQETIKFPELDISIEIFQVKGSTVRLGIDAPVEVKVLRGELESPDQPEVTKKILVSAKDVHDMRNKLNGLTIAAGLAKKLLALGETNVAASTLDEALESLSSPTADSLTVSADGTPTNAPRALLIEDAANEREMLAGFLRLHGYAVDTVNDGVEAMEFLEENEKPDFVLVDMNMPRLDGAGVIEQIRSNVAFDKVEIFAVSGQTPKSAGVDIHKNRVADWFQKPLQPAGLVAAIHERVSKSAKSKTADPVHLN